MIFLLIQDLTTVLTIAEQLKIRGLCSVDKKTGETCNTQAPNAIVTDKYANTLESNIIRVDVNELDRQEGAAANPPTMKAAKPAGHGHVGRKGYLPKKLRMSGDSDSVRSATSSGSHGFQMSPEGVHMKQNGEGDIEAPSGMRTPDTDGTNERPKSGDGNNGSLNGGDENPTMDEDQPVDYSQNAGTSNPYKPRYSILSKNNFKIRHLDHITDRISLITGNYLKKGNERRKRQNLLPLENGLEDQNVPPNPTVPINASSIEQAAGVSVQ